MFNRRYFSVIGKALLFAILVVATAGCAAKSTGEKQSASVSDGTLSISDIHTSATDNGFQVSIKGDGDLNYTAVKQRDPLGVILYFPLTRLSGPSSVSVAENDIVADIVPSMSKNKKNTRIRVDLLQDVAYDVEKEGSNLDIVFNRKPVQDDAPEQTARSPRSAAEKPLNLSRTGQSSGNQSMQNPGAQQAESPAQDAGEPALVKRVDFSAQQNGKSVVLIQTERPVEYQVKKLEQRLLKIVLPDTYLPDYHQHRPLITTRFDSAVDRIIPSRGDKGKNLTHILIELRQAVPYRPVKSGDELRIHFEPSEIAPRPFESANLPAWQKVLETAASKSGRPDEHLAREAAEDQEAAEKDRYAELLGEKKKYSGQKIALDFYETNIKNVFRILQQVSGKNFAIDPNVSGSVTLSFQKPVPWDQVLDLVLQMNQLGKVEKGNIIRIATKETLRAEEEARRQRIEAIKQREQQQKELDPLITEYVPVSYANAQNEVLPHVKDVLSEERGSVSVDQRNNQLIITDTREKIQKAKEIIAKIDKVTPQVIIEARIVEANDNFSRKFGISWGVEVDNDYNSQFYEKNTYDSIVNTPFIGGGTADASTEAPSTFNFTFERLPESGTSFLLDATLRAMETDQVLKIISTPKIVTLDNKEATITQGIEYPYQNVEDEEVETEFKEINLTLKVTPHITPDDRVSLEINLQKDDIREITPAGEPSLSTNEAITELLIDNGQTIVIGGIVKRTESDANAGVPFLKDIPGLGWLFSSTQNEVSKRELLIFMTPTIVQLEQKETTQVSSNNT